MTRIKSTVLRITPSRAAKYYFALSWKIIFPVRRLFAYQCSVCSKPIVPKEGQTKAPRIRALDRDFHPQCFKCEVSHWSVNYFSCLLSTMIFYRTVVTCWTLVSRVLSVGPSDTMFSATNATDEDKANLSPREKIDPAGGEGLFGEETTYLINL